MLQDLGSDHLRIHLCVPLSPVFRPNERPPSFNFQKARWDDFVSYFDSHCPSAGKYTSLSSASALFTPQALNAAKFSIPFDRIKRHHKAWCSAEVEGAITERHKAFAAAHRSDEDHQAYISASRRASSVIAKAKLRHDRQLVLLFPATDSLRRSLFGDSLSLYDLSSKPFGFSRLLGLHGLPPCPHPLEGVR